MLLVMLRRYRLRRLHIRRPRLWRLLSQAPTTTESVRAKSWRQLHFLREDQFNSSIATTLFSSIWPQKQQRSNRRRHRGRSRRPRPPARPRSLRCQTPPQENRRAPSIRNQHIFRPPTGSHKAAVHSAASKSRQVWEHCPRRFCAVRRFVLPSHALPTAQHIPSRRER